MQTIFAGFINTSQLAAFALTLNYLTMVIKIPLAISWANGIIVSNKLGNKRGDDACAGWDGALILSTLTTLMICIVTFFGRKYITLMYTSQGSNGHDDIRTIMENCLIILSVYMMIDQLQRCGQGAISGMGKQKFGAIANVISYYLFGR